MADTVSQGGDLLLRFFQKIRFIPLIFLIRIKADQPDMDTDIKHRQVGGIGIFLTCKMANKITYTRKDDKNILKIMLTPHVVVL